MDICIFHQASNMADRLLRKYFNVSFMFCTLALFFTFDFGNFVEAKPSSVRSDSDGSEYLMKFGWLSPQDPKTGALRSREEFTRAIKTFQRFAQLNVTGKLDKETVTLMNTPRCGVRDNVGPAEEEKRRVKRYALQGSRWGKTDLSYKVIRYTRDVPREDVDADIRAAFQIWADVTPLRFTQLFYGKADIEIAFLDMDHGDGIPFDGEEGTLAHAYFPVYGGDAHFDDGEIWSVNSNDGTNLFQVAAHEFGHSLGVSHSDVRQSLMAPFYRGYAPGFVLHVDDVMAIQELYGPNPDAPTVPTTTAIYRPTSAPRAPPVGVPDACADPHLDAITQTKSGVTYAFKGKYYWRLNRRGYDKGYPRLIKWDWPGLPANIDTALHMRHSGYTFFFKGDQYWKFRDQTPMNGYPRKISWGFPGIPNNVDAAFVWTGNGKVYFIKGDQYWRYSQLKADYGYPRPMSVWRGIPKGITGAFQYRTSKGYRTYFFNRYEYYRFNDRTFSVDPNYPRLVAEWWFGCDAETERLVHINSVNGQGIGRGANRGRDGDNGGSQWLVAGGETAAASNSNGFTSGAKELQSQKFISLLLLIAFCSLFGLHL